MKSLASVNAALCSCMRIIVFCSILLSKGKTATREKKKKKRKKKESPSPLKEQKKKRKEQEKEDVRAGGMAAACMRTLGQVNFCFFEFG